MSIFLTKCRKIKAVLSTDWTFFQIDVFVDIFIAEIWKLKYCDVYRLLGTKKQERDFWLDRDIDRHWAGKESDEWDEKMEGVLLGLHEWGKWEKRTDGGKWISKKEAREALKRMKNGSWSSWISVLPQVWGCLGEWLFNAILKNDRISEEWRRSVLILSFRNKRAVVTAQSWSATPRRSRKESWKKTSIEKVRQHFTLSLWKKDITGRRTEVDTSGREVCECGGHGWGQEDSGEVYSRSDRWRLAHIRDQLWAHSLFAAVMDRLTGRSVCRRWHCDL